MPCERCGGSLEHLETERHADGFTERMRCVGCGAFGSVRGSTDQNPEYWTFSGDAYDAQTRLDEL